MPKIGLYLCECGPNIADVIDLDRVRAEVERGGHGAGIERHRLLCSEAGQQFVADTIREKGYDRVVIAACSPKQHEATFAAVLARLGMNPQLLQMVNVREQCAWTTPNKDEATAKAARLVRAAVNRVRFHEPLEQREIECNPDVLVIGGGIAGIEVALRTAQPGRKVYLVERDSLGGMLTGRSMLFPGMEPASAMLARRTEELRAKPYVEVFEGTRVREVLGFFGSFVVRLDRDGAESECQVGAVVLATGARSAGPEGTERFGLGRLEGVYTADEFERTGVEKLAGEVKAIAIVHCAGREKLGYCSRFCCANAMKLARQVKTTSPQTEVVEFYTDLCLPGKEYDRFLGKTKDEGVRFVRAEVAGVEQVKGRLAVRYREPGQNEASMPVDAVVLATGLLPDEGNAALAEMTGIELDRHGFFKEGHLILDPSATSVEGVFAAGCAQGPGAVSDTVAKAAAAAGRVLSALVPGRKLQLEPRTSEVSSTFCVGCGVCVAACAYGAVVIDEERRVSVVNEVLCRGCGNCAAACPSGAARHRHFTNRQLRQEVTEILE